ncbi:MAG: NAD(P)-dependent oxidoreductase [Nitrospirae bacterium]|nr:NAD(P)-dependent oxidoreductase [Nitrospirota bacterium]MCL5976726.1 NAD(P)-dependent oxidoreductase [Nitrospirota bacterium]
MRIFITGVSSFIGRELIRQCDEQGVTVAGNDLFITDFSRFLIGDIRDASVADQIPEGTDAIVHLAALSRDSDCKNNAYSCFDANVMGTLNLMEAAKNRGVKQFIFASTEWVYDSFNEGEPPKTEESVINIANLTSEYALSKIVSEVNLRQKYLQGFCSVTILRFGIIYGPRKDNWSAAESLFNSVATSEKLTVGSLRTARHFIHVSDIASAIIKSVGVKGFEILNIQGDRLITLGDIIESSKKITGKNPLVHESSPDKPSVRRISNKKAKEMLDWAPVFDLEKGLQTFRKFLA